MKEVLTSKTILRPPDYKDPNRPLILTVDASPVGAGAVLQQNDKEGNRYAIRRKVLNEIHGGGGGGHRGRDSTLKLEFKTWNSVNWKPEMSTEELLTSRMHQLEAKDELILDVADR
ncbi:hypothetical protein AYI70_g4730, partial [Smittium culicis]